MLFRFEKRIPAWKRSVILVAIGVAVAIASQRAVEAELGGLSAPGPAEPAAARADAAAGPATAQQGASLMLLALATSAWDQSFGVPSPAPDSAPHAQAQPDPYLAARAVQVRAVAVPEPSTAPLLGAGLIVLLLLARRVGSPRPRQEATSQEGAGGSRIP